VREIAGKWVHAITSGNTYAVKELRLGLATGGCKSAGGATLGHNGGMQTLTEICRKLVDLVFAIDSDGLAGGIEDDFAVMALADVSLDLGEEAWVNFAIEVVGKLGQEIGAGHGLGPPFFCLK
jgi:hypothetical protein